MLFAFTSDHISHAQLRTNVKSPTQPSIMDDKKEKKEKKGKTREKKSQKKTNWQLNYDSENVFFCVWAFHIFNPVLRTLGSIMSSVKP